LEGFYEPICRTGENQFKIPEVNVIRVGERYGYVMGALGESCPDDQNIVRSSDCEAAIRDLRLDTPSLHFNSLVGDTGTVGGCSLKSDEVRAFYNDKHPRETNIPDNEPASLFYPAAGNARCEERLNRWCASNTPYRWARFDRSWRSSRKEWRCYSTGALTADTYDVNTYNLPSGPGGTCTRGSPAGTLDPLDATCWNHFTRNSELSSLLEECNPQIPDVRCQVRAGKTSCRRIRSGTRRGGSYPICYAKGVFSTNPIQERRIRFTSRYAFNVPDCPRGYFLTGGHKSCSAFLCPGCFCAECFQPYWTCPDRDAILVEGRRVPSHEISTVAYCLDSKALGHK